MDKPTSEEILEGNILIGQYVGITMWYNTGINELTYNVRSDVPAYLSNWKEMQFHSSWDWLIPACEAFCNSEHPIDKHDEFNERVLALDSDIIHYKIVPVWRRLVENLNWLKS